MLPSDTPSPHSYILLNGAAVDHEVPLDWGTHDIAVNEIQPVRFKPEQKLDFARKLCLKRSALANCLFNEFGIHEGRSILVEVGRWSGHHEMDEADPIASRSREGGWGIDRKTLATAPIDGSDDAVQVGVLRPGRNSKKGGNKGQGHGQRRECAHFGFLHEKLRREVVADLYRHEGCTLCLVAPPYIGACCGT